MHAKHKLSRKRKLQTRKHVDYNLPKHSRTCRVPTPFTPPGECDTPAIISMHAKNKLSRKKKLQTCKHVDENLPKHSRTCHAPTPFTPPGECDTPTTGWGRRRRPPHNHNIMLIDLSLQNCHNTRIIAFQIGQGNYLHSCKKWIE
jgi:hypothetical protein